MSAETDYLQSIIDRKVEFLTNPAYSPAIIGGELDFGIEITVVEANQMRTWFEPGGAFRAHLSPGQKSYMRAATSGFRETQAGIRSTPQGPRAFSQRTGLNFPRSGHRRGSRWHAYQPTAPNWIDAVPWDRAPALEVRTIEISLLPLRPGPRIGFPPTSDDRVHLRVTDAAGTVSQPTNLRFDPVAKQYIGEGPRIEAIDHPSLWLVSFFLFMHPPP